MVRISRRRFLKGAAAATAGVLVTGRMKLLPTLAADSLFPLASPVTEFSASVIRPDDFLALRFDFYNITLSQANSSGVGAATLVPVASPAYIIVNLPPQNIAEQAFYEAGLDPDSATGVTRDGDDCSRRRIRTKRQSWERTAPASGERQVAIVRVESTRLRSTLRSYLHPVHLDWDSAGDFNI